MLVNGLTAIGATVLKIPPSSVNDYEANAYRAAQAALLARRSQVISCTPTSSADATCMRTLATRFVPLAFRRPATEAELTRWTAVGVEAAEAYDDFVRGAEFLLAGLLQSPAFLYLDEVGETDGAWRRLTAWELASRVSFFLTSGPPDELLREAAANGSLLTDEGLRAQAARLLEKPEARAASLALFDELLELHNLDHLAKDSARFPGFDAQALAPSMREETHRVLLDLVFDSPGDFRDILTTRTTFVDGPLAQHYGMPPVSGWTRATAAEGRAGILTHAAFLSLQSHPSANSPTYRGRFIRERLLCQVIPAPPPEVDTSLPPAAPGTQRTLRQRLTEKTSASRCQGCHRVMDPPGFAFERFDAIGRVQALDDGLPIDTSGSLDERGAFDDAPGMLALLREDARFTDCLARVVFRQAVGHVDLPGEARPLKAAADAFTESGHRYQSLLVELVASEAFRSGVLEDAP